MSGSFRVTREFQWSTSIAALCLLGTSFETSAASPLFESHEPVEAVLRAPLARLNRERKQDEREEHPGQFEFTSADGEPVVLDVKVRSRGNFRRRQCRWPPLRLNFRKDQVAGTLFDGQDKLKLVLPCERSRRYENFVIVEYLIYRLYSALSDYSYQVRPLQVEFVDSSGRGSPQRRFAFVIEPTKDMAKRYKREVADWEEASFKQFKAERLALFELFQFMIGGHDWSVLVGPDGERCCHNSRLLVVPGSREDVIPVPYDFDMTGMVNTPYATPPVEVPIRSVRQRYFRGRCPSPEALDAAIAHFDARRDVILGLLGDYPALPDKPRRQAVQYIESFYEILDDPERRAKMITDKCERRR